MLNPRQCWSNWSLLMHNKTQESANHVRDTTNSHQILTFSPGTDIYYQWSISLVKLIFYIFDVSNSHLSPMTKISEIGCDTTNWLKHNDITNGMNNKASEKMIFSIVCVAWFDWPYITNKNRNLLCIKIDIWLTYVTYSEIRITLEYSTHQHIFLSISNRRHTNEWVKGWAFKQLEVSNELVGHITVAFKLRRVD